VGSRENPLTVGLNSFHGFAPGLYANGNSLKTQSGSIFDRKGVQVEFKIQDNIPTLPEQWNSGNHCSWRTSDFWAQEQPNLRNAKLDGRAVMMVDNTQGADAIVSNDLSIKSIEDLAHHSVALLQYTPSHGLLVDGLNNSSLSSRNRASVKTVFISAESGTAEVRAALSKRSVEAAVLWDPDLSLAIKDGAHVVYSTKTASNLIFDAIVCDTRVINNSQGFEAVLALVDGWMSAVKEVNANKQLGITALTSAFDVYKALSQDQSNAFVQGLFNNLVLTGLADNIRIMGLNGGTNHYERVYAEFDAVYRSIGGTLTNPNSPVISPSDSIDYRFIKKLMEKDLSAQAAANKPAFTFTAAEAKQASAVATPELTKPVLINFDTNSAILDRSAQAVVDNQVRPLIENFGNSYFEINGNTDSTGSQAVNQRLSLARAQAVVTYLSKEWEIPAERFAVKGNGSTRPLCNEQSPEEGLSLGECRARNRTTRIAVLGR